MGRGRGGGKTERIHNPVACLHFLPIFDGAKMTRYRNEVVKDKENDKNGNNERRSKRITT